MIPKPRFTLQDFDKAYEDWGANCGPGALAVVAGLTLDDVRKQMGDFERKRYTNPTLMFECLNRTGLIWRSVKPPDWPEFGLARVQWDGPWMDPGVPIAARYRHTHWVAGARASGQVGVFDINCLNNGSGWVTLEEWSDVAVPFILREAEPRANGRWHLTHAIEITRGV